MRSLLVRALAWTLLTFLLAGLVGRASTELRGHQVSLEVVRTMMDLGLDERLVQLEAEPPGTRRDVLATFPPGMVRRLTLLDRSDVETDGFSRTVIDQRPVWFEAQALYIELSGEQIVRVEGTTGLYRVVYDPRSLVIPVVLVLATLSSIAIVFPVARRIRKLSQASSKVAAGDLSVRVNDTSKDAVGELARQFDRMTAAIEAQTREREAFFHSVAHELGTPLSRMGLILELLQQADDGEDRAQRMGQLEQELDELEAMTAELLTWAAEDLDRPLETHPLPVAEILQELVDREPSDAIAVTVDAPSGLVLHAEPDAFRRATDNVLRNARRYAVERVTIRVVGGEDAVDVVIEDDGPGITPADRKRIFEPFARADASRDRSTGGTGLGLAIVARILERHQGSVQVTRSAALGGAAFVLSWPANRHP